ncbi:hypothetical protein F5148DRAFT_1377961 [Russula earlei]|uniref:Uncharacterized protein n=1 Tax=Russula earlei TaxID=71964 RepID=A0ACC0U2W8_9AGAM|nr:hypothetical protein F5148DRAFT_1377961 [Russula earlei]
MSRLGSAPRGLRSTSEPLQCAASRGSWVVPDDHLTPKGTSLLMSFRLRIRRLRYPLTSLTGFVQSLLPRPVRSSATVGGPSQASLETSPCEHFQEVTINTLPDDVLVETFYFHVNSRPIQINAWHTLVHHIGKDSQRRYEKPFPELTSLVIWTEIRIPCDVLSWNRSWADPPHFYENSGWKTVRSWEFLNYSFSASQLVVLDLWDIPDSGYISPQDLGTALSVVSRLEALLLKFRSPLYPASRPPPPLTRSVLPVLTRLEFKGVHEYLEDLVAQIEAPLLNKLEVTFFMDNDFVIPQLHRLISHALSFKECDRAEVRTSELAIQFAIFRGATWFLSLEISSTSWIGFSQPHWDDMVTTQWLDLLGPFTAVKHLRLSRRVAPHVCRALEELADERVTGVLPSLNNIFLSNLPASESVPTYIKGFVATRKLSGHPVAVHRWEWGQVL